MAFLFNGTTQYLNTSSAPATATPLTIACWFYPTSSSQNYALMSLCDNAEVGGNRFALLAVGAVNGSIRALTQNELADSTAVFVANSWQHACGVFSASNSRTAFLNGGNSATNTASATPSGIDRVRIGARFSGGSAGFFMDGNLAEVGIWNAALTADEVASLAKGMTCDKVRPQNLKFYAPLIRNLQDVKGGLTITNNNTATVANHPRVYA